MPFTINGIGTKVYSGRGRVGWGSFDAVEWFVILYAPLIPIRCLHTFGWSAGWTANRYQSIPIRWSAALVFRSFLRPWLCWFIFIGVILCIVGAIAPIPTAAGARKPMDSFSTAGMQAWGATLLITALIMYLALSMTDQRASNLRRVLGPHQLGSCDPALMRRPMSPDPRKVYGTACFADAVPGLLEAGRYSRAMWAARLSTAWEDSVLGEELTDRILRHPGVRKAVEQVRRNPRCWAKVMLSPVERQARQRRS